MICYHCKERMDIVWGMASHGRAYCSEKCFDERKGDGVLLYFMNDCRDLKLSAIKYFELAYMVTFGKMHPNVGLDYAQWCMNTELPVYVRNFIKSKQEQSCASTPYQPQLFSGQSDGSATAPSS